MFSLVRKDLVVARWFLLVALPLFALQLVGVATTPPAFVIVTLLFSALFAFGPIGIEEMQGTELLWCSLPVSRLDVVLGRYAATLLGIVAGLGISRAVGGVAFDWMSRHSEAVPGHIGVEVYAVLFFLLATGAALFLPCYFRWGAGKGLQAFLLIVLGLLILFGAGGSLVVSLTGGPGDLSDPDPARVAGVEAWLEGWSRVLAGALAAVALLGFCVSAALSARIYRSRDC